MFKNLLAAGLLLVAASCLPKVPPRPLGDPEWGIKITYHGHSCFSIQDSAGRHVLIDLFSPTLGLPPPKVKPTVLLITHDHFDHNHIPPKGKFEIVNATGTHHVDGLVFKGGEAFHDNQQGRRNGTTRFYVWEMAGLRLAHLGDIGQETLTPEQAAVLKDIDVLFIPVGGKVTLNAAGAAAVVKTLRPRAVFPMHYHDGRSRFLPLDPLDHFLPLFDNIEKVSGATVRLRQGSLSGGPKVHQFVAASTKQ